MEVVPYHEGPTQAVVPAAPSALPAAAHAIVEWAAAAEAAYQLAQKLVVTSFVPDAFRGKPDHGAAAIIAGAEVGLSPVAALRSFDVIGGVAAPRALTLRAIAQAQGHEFVVDVATPTQCVMRGRRRGTSEWQTVEWTIKRAETLGLTTRTRDASKNPWVRQPQTMLVARATTEIVRLVAADAVLGIAYSAEELTDEAAATTTLTRATTTKTKVRRQTPAPEPELAPAATPEPDVPTTTSHDVAPEPKQPASRTPERDTATSHDVAPEIEPPGPPVDAGGPRPAKDDDESDNAGERSVTRAQLSKIGAGMRELGITDRYDALGYVAQAIGRQVSSRNELTVEEASVVISSLEFDRQPDPDGPEEDQP